MESAIPERSRHPTSTSDSGINRSCLRKGQRGEPVEGGRRKAEGERALSRRGRRRTLGRTDRWASTGSPNWSIEPVMVGGRRVSSDARHGVRTWLPLADDDLFHASSRFSPGFPVQLTSASTKPHTVHLSLFLVTSSLPPRRSTIRGLCARDRNRASPVCWCCCCCCLVFVLASPRCSVNSYFSSSSFPSTSTASSFLRLRPRPPVRLRQNCRRRCYRGHRRCAAAP